MQEYIVRMRKQNKGDMGVWQTETYIQAHCLGVFVRQSAVLGEQYKASG